MVRDFIFFVSRAYKMLLLLWCRILSVIADCVKLKYDLRCFIQGNCYFSYLKKKSHTQIIQGGHLWIRG